MLDAVRPGMLYTTSGNRGLGGNRCVVLDDAFRHRPVVVRRDQQCAVGARLLGVASQHDRCFRGIGTGARDDAYASAGCRHDHLDHPAVLGVREGGGLAGAAAGHQAIDTGPDLDLHQLL